MQDKLTIEATTLTKLSAFIRLGTREQRKVLLVKRSRARPELPLRLNLIKVRSTWNKTTKSFVLRHMKTHLLQFLLFAALLQIAPVNGQAPAVQASAVKPTVEDLLKCENLTAVLLAPDGKSTMFMVQQTDLGINRKY